MAIVIVLSLADVIIPIPLIGVLLIVVLVERPRWFLNAVRRIYHVEE